MLRMNSGAYEHGAPTKEEIATDMNGRIVGLALKPEHRGPMREVDEAEIGLEGLEGLEGNAAQSDYRRVTLISREQWDEVQNLLNTSLPWHTRRANILVEGLPLAGLIGKKVRLGEAELEVNGETEPCSRMDQIFPGLRRALEPDCRGGVYAAVLKPGAVCVGDTIGVLDESHTSDE